MSVEENWLTKEFYRARGRRAMLPRRYTLMNRCKNCGNQIKISIFKGGDWCSDDCRKALEHEDSGSLPGNQNEVVE